MEDSIKSNQVVQAQILNDQLIIAATALDADQVDKLIDQNANVNYCNDQTSVLLAAARSANESIQRNHPQETEEVKLEICSKVMVLRKLIQQNADINAKIGQEGNTVLGKVLEDSQYTVARFLIANKAHIDALDNDGKSILYKLHKEHHYGAAKFLLQQGANPLSEEEVKSLNEDSHNREVQEAIPPVNKASSDDILTVHQMFKTTSLPALCTMLTSNPPVGWFAKDNEGRTVYDILTARNCAVHKDGRSSPLSFIEQQFLNNLLETLGQQKIAAENNQKEIIEEEILQPSDRPSRTSQDNSDTQGQEESGNAPLSSYVVLSGDNLFVEEPETDMDAIDFS